MMDYENDAIDINKLFEQLVYIAYDSSSVDEKYKSDYDFYVTFEELGIDDILEDNFEELDEEIVKFYLTNRYMLNVSIGVEGPDVVTSNVNVLPWLSSTTKDEEYLSNAYNHNLDHVYLSPNENFLIWYTPTGDDAITDEQLSELAEGLEETIKKYEIMFNIEYSYDPHIDNKLGNKDYNNAKNILESADISIDRLKTAMSVYVYDTGSDNVPASYCDEEDGKKFISRSILFDLLDEDGIVNYPYMVINKRGIKNSMDSLTQLYNHELFHHFQFIYCMEKTEDRNLSDLRLSEAMANFASSISSDVSMTNNHYKVDMSSEELEGLMSSAEVDSSTVGGNTYVDVYTKNGYITRLEYDCSDLIPGYDIFTAVINISNYDNAGDVEIPQVVIDNSQEM